MKLTSHGNMATTAKATTGPIKSSSSPAIESMDYSTTVIAPTIPAQNCSNGHQDTQANGHVTENGQAPANGQVTANGQATAYDQGTADGQATAYGQATANGQVTANGHQAKVNHRRHTTCAYPKRQRAEIDTRYGEGSFIKPHIVTQGARGNSMRDPHVFKPPRDISPMDTTPSDIQPHSMHISTENKSPKQSDSSTDGPAIRVIPPTPYNKFPLSGRHSAPQVIQTVPAPYRNVSMASSSSGKDSAPHRNVSNVSSSSGKDSGLLTPRSRRQKYRRKPTVLGVTQDARQVLEEFLQRSLSQNDSSPVHRERHHIPSSSVHREEDIHNASHKSTARISSPTSPVVRGVPMVPEIDSIDALPNITDVLDGPPSYLTRQEGYSAASLDSVLDDHDEPESPLSLSSASSSRANSLKTRIEPRTDKDVRDALKRPKKSRHSPSASCSSESNDTNSSARIKKSVFRRTVERVRANFRRLKSEPQAHRTDKFDTPTPTTSHRSPPRKGKKPKDSKKSSLRSTFSFKIKTPGSEKSLTGLKRQKTRSNDMLDTLEEGAPRKKGEKRSSVFDTVLRQIRGSTKRKKPSQEESGHKRSNSADASTFGRIDQSEWSRRSSQRDAKSEEILNGDRGAYYQRGGGLPGGIQRPVPGPLPSLPPPSGLLGPEAMRRLRSQQRLDLIDVATPANSENDDSKKLAERKASLRRSFFEGRTTEQDGLSEDEVDGAVGGEPAQPERGVMFERVADQLAAIADNYENLSPHSPADEGDASGFAARCIATVTPSLEGALGRMLRERGDQIADELGEQISPIVSQMVRHASYNSFSNVMTESLGQEPSWQQLALMFRLTKAAVALVGSGTEKALSIKDMTLQFFEDQFAGWVVTQGGWESMVEDTDLSSELD